MVVQEGKRVKVRNNSLYNTRMKATKLPHSLAQARCPRQTHLQANTFCLSVHFPSGSTGLSTELPAFFFCAQGLAGDTSHALAEHTQHWSPAHGAGPTHTTQTGGSWRASNSAKGHSQKLAAHRGYFGQGTAICQVWKQRSLHVNPQPLAQLSPRADSGADLPSIKHLDVLP